MHWLKEAEGVCLAVDLYFCLAKKIMMISFKYEARKGYAIAWPFLYKKYTPKGLFDLKARVIIWDYSSLFLGGICKDLGLKFP